MKILVLTPWYPSAESPNHGIFIRNQVKALSQSHEVRVIAARVDYTSFSFSSLTREDSTFEGIRETRLVVKKSLPVFNQVNYFYRIVREAARIAASFKPDIIHGHIGYGGGVWSFRLSKKLGIPYVLTEHTRIINNFRSAIHKKLSIEAYDHAAAVVLVSQSQVKEFSSYVKNPNIVVLPNVVDFQQFPGVVSRSQESIIHIGFLGGMNTNVKGLDTLLQALARTDKNIRLHIGGAGALMESYKAMSESLGIVDRCVFYGFVSPAEIYSFMSRLHFLVSASRFETFGVANVEAMACGLPVLATDSGGPSAYITDATGVIVPKEDPARMAVAIEEMIRDYHRYNPQAIRNFVLEKFSARTFLDKMHKVYKDAM